MFAGKRSTRQRVGALGALSTAGHYAIFCRKITLLHHKTRNVIRSLVAVVTVKAGNCTTSKHILDRSRVQRPDRPEPKWCQTYP